MSLTAKKHTFMMTPTSSRKQLCSLLNGKTDYIATLRDMFRWNVKVDLEKVPQSVSLLVDEEVETSKPQAIVPEPAKPSTCSTFCTWCFYILFLAILLVALHETIKGFREEKTLNRHLDNFVPPDMIGRRGAL